MRILGRWQVAGGRWPAPHLLHLELPRPLRHRLVPRRALRRVPKPLPVVELDVGALEEADPRVVVALVHLEGGLTGRVSHLLEGGAQRFTVLEKGDFRARALL